MIRVQSIVRCVVIALMFLASAAVVRGQDAEKAQLRVLLPADDAKLEIQGRLSTKTGTVRYFESPPLPIGKAFVYDLKVTWTENGKTATREKTARVMAGQTTEVDLRIDDKVAANDSNKSKPADPKTNDPKPLGPKPGDPMPPAVKPEDVKPMATKPEDVKPMATKPEDVKPMATKPADPKPPLKLDVPYVKTPEVIVDEMLKMAKVKEGDVVYDLGCGDGRIVIRAITNYKAKAGVGIDIDPDRVKESAENAKKAGVQDKTTFKVGDVLKLTEKDLEGATVIAMYLFPKINDQLAPMLKKLPKGTRIVSHDFKITDWAPDDSVEAIEVEGIDHSVYMWTIK